MRWTDETIDRLLSYATALEKQMIAERTIGNGPKERLIYAKWTEHCQLIGSAYGSPESILMCPQK